MQNLDAIVERIRLAFDARTQARDQALAQARAVTRHAAHAIRAVHRDETDLALENISAARTLVGQMRADLTPYPDLLYAGYTQDSFKEYVEASITYALVQDKSIPEPEDLGVEYATYLNGLAEVSGELRRRCLDILRQGYSKEAERLLAAMDDIYNVLVTMDYPDAITNGLRRQTDLVRGIVERTRGDLTISLREQHLEHVMAQLETKLAQANGDAAGSNA